MTRTVGYVLGGLLLLRGAIVALQPRLLARLWETRMRRHFPESINSLLGDFFRLSDPTIRVIGGWVMVMGGLVLWMASKLKDE